MRLWVLGSGSRGNAILIEHGDCRILIDAGFPPQVLIQRLRAAEIAPESINALVITHEHTDHIRGARALCERFGWTAYATSGTITSAAEIAPVGAVAFRPGEAFAVNGFDIESARASHDAAEPVALAVSHRATGARAGVAYDLGIITHPVATMLRNVDVLVLESNHDELMLHNGPYPPSVRARIAGRSGHLSNRAAADMAAMVAHRGLRHVVLAHLSESCNAPRTALADVGATMRRTRFGGRITVSRQDAVVGPFDSARYPHATQLSLGL